MSVHNKVILIDLNLPTGLSTIGLAILGWKEGMCECVCVLGGGGGGDRTGESK